MVAVTLADGRRAAVGPSYTGGARWLDVEVTTGVWAGVLAHGISDADLLSIGELVQLDAAGRASVVGRRQPDDDR